MRYRERAKTQATVAKLEQYRIHRLVELPRAPDVPAGARTGPPDYVGIGIQKAGTTWWNRLLSEHPQNESKFKEIRFFQVGWNGDFGDPQIEQYQSYFPRSPGSISGEWTPNYMMQAWTIERLSRAAPDATLLVLLRDPLARLRSGLRHYAFRFPGPLEMEHVCQNIDAGLYAQQLDTVTRYFPREQVFLLQYERCLSKPASELARTYDRLGVDPEFRPAQITEPVNQGQGTPVALSRDFESEISDLYRADGARLAHDWPELDLDLWPSVGPSR